MRRSYLLLLGLILSVVTLVVTPFNPTREVLAAPQLFPAAVCGQVGDVIIVDGLAFTPNQLALVTWSGIVLGTEPAPLQVDPAGRLRFSFIVPNDQAGQHTVRVTDQAVSAQFLFDLGAGCPSPTATATPAQPTGTPTPTSTATPPTPVAEQPRLRCEPADVSPTDLVTVYGENFQPGGHFYELRWDDVVIPWAPEGLTIGDDGRFTLRLAAPSDTYSLHTVVADDGQGGQAECYLDLTPRDPTPTWTPTPTLTPTPTMTWTPGPPPGMTVTPTVMPDPADYCADIKAVFTRQLLVGGSVTAGVEVTNRHLAWPDGQLQLGVWQYSNLFETDTGVRAKLPGLAIGESTTVSLSFPAPATAGPVWYQLRLIDTTTGIAAGCPSDWYPLHYQAAAPYPPPLVTPPDGVWLNSRQLALDWLAAGAPAGAGPMDSYEVQLMDLRSGSDLLVQTVAPDVTEWAHLLKADYGANQLAWRVRARNAAGWGLWATAFTFGVDTIAPTVELSLAGEAGDNGWWRSPLTVRVGGNDSTLGSGLMATYLQPGRAKWQQVIPGGETIVEQEGEFLLRLYGRDQALNRSAVLVRPVKVDYQPPHSLAVIFAHEPTSSGWYTAPLTITLEAEDVVSGIAETELQVNGTGWQSATASLVTEGRHLIEFKARDIAGNETAVYETSARLDLSPPSGAIALNGSLCQACPPLTASVATGDGQSGLGHWELAVTLPVVDTSSLAATILTSGSEPAQEIFLDGGELPPGPLTLTLAVQDVAGWVSTTEIQIVNEPSSAGPTPTPWLVATATPWPEPTPGTWPYATLTPVPTSPVGGGDGGGDDDGGSSGNSGGSRGSGSTTDAGPVGYPVGGQVVPAILPVTGGGRPGLWPGLGLTLILVSRLIWTLTKRKRPDPVASPRVDHLHHWYSRSHDWARALARSTQSDGQQRPDHNLTKEQP